MANVFIAYAGADLQFVSRLRNELAIRTQHTIWAAEFNLQPGSEWRSEIDRQLRASHFFVPLISRSFLDRPEPRRELSAAMDLADAQHLHVFPILIDDLPYLDLPIAVRATQYIRHQPFDAVVAQLLRSLEGGTQITNLETLRSRLAAEPLDNSSATALVDLILASRWPNQNDTSKALKLIADKRRNAGDRAQAVHIYNIIVDDLSPRNASVRVTRAELRSESGDLPGADADCVAVLSQEPSNVFALHKRFWINHAWFTSSHSQSEAAQRLQVMVQTLETLHNVQQSEADRFWPVTFRAFAEGSYHCQRSDFADNAHDLINRKGAAILNIDRADSRVTLLQGLRTLAAHFERVGDAVRCATTNDTRQKLEAEWRIYQY